MMSETQRGIPEQKHDMKSINQKIQQRLDQERTCKYSSDSMDCHAIITLRESRAAGHAWYCSTAHMEAAQLDEQSFSGV